MSRKLSKKEHVLRGTFQPHRHDKKNEVKIEPGRPAPPDYMSDKGKECFNQLADEVEAMGILTVADKFILELAANTMEEHFILTEFIKKNGRTYTNETMAGAVIYKQWPQIQQLQDCSKRFFAILKDMGLTPASKGKMNIEAKPMGEDPFDDYMKAQGNRFAGQGFLK